MAKRQRRVNASDLNSEATELIGHPLSLIMRNGMVYFIKILNISDNILISQDMRSLKKRIPLKDIREIIIEI